MNEDLRLKIVEMVHRSGEGHIPSSFSIVDIIEYLYGNTLRYKKSEPAWDERDYFILSKGHGCGALYAVLHKYGFLSDQEILDYSSSKGILGGHPDMTKVPGAEASTGSLGHGFPTAVGLAMGLRIQNKNNRIYALVGDGECHEGTVWEAANIANNQSLGNLCVVVDWNGSAAQLMPKDDLLGKWSAFGWESYEMDGHSTEEFRRVFEELKFQMTGKPKAILAKTTKGKGVSFIEGHGKWHHRIPNREELHAIMRELKT